MKTNSRIQLRTFPSIFKLINTADVIEVNYQTSSKFFYTDDADGGRLKVILEKETKMVSHDSLERAQWDGAAFYLPNGNRIAFFTLERMGLE